MASVNRLNITGQKEFAELMAQLPNTLEKKIVPKMVRVMTRPIINAMRRRVVVRGGLLKKSLKVKVKTYRSGVTVAIMGASNEAVGYYKGVLERPKFITHLVDQGTKKHEQPLLPRKKSGPNAGGIRIHPGAKAKPYLKISFRENQANSIAAGKALLQSEISKLKTGVK